MTANEILIELEKYGDAQTKKTLSKHGAREPFFFEKGQIGKKRKTARC